MDEKKMEKLLSELEELVCGKNENQENVEKAKKSIIEDLEKNPRAMIYVSPRGTVTTGRANEIMACIAMIFDQLRDDDLNTEMLTIAFMSGMTKCKKDKEARETVDTILETIKKFI